MASHLGYRPRSNSKSHRSLQFRGFFFLTFIHFFSLLLIGVLIVCYYLFLNNIGWNYSESCTNIYLPFSLIHSRWRASSVCTAGINIHKRPFMQFVSSLSVNFLEWVSSVASTYAWNIFMNVFTSGFFLAKMQTKQPWKLQFVLYKRDYCSGTGWHQRYPWKTQNAEKNRN